VASAVIVTPGSAWAQDCAPAGQEATGTVAWAQQFLAPQRAWPLSRGAGVTVAVLDTGVDATQPRLAGRVLAGVDARNAGASGASDCAGHGTALAGIIAASPVSTDIFTGLAPGATILPVRVADQADAAGADPRVLAAGIVYATQHGARVILVGIPAYTDAAELAAAVAFALGHDVVVVSAAGDVSDATRPAPPTYPTSAGGVIGVGAVDPAGALAPFSPHRADVDLVAPGLGVVTLQRQSGLATVDGTAVAAGFVAGAAALVRARFPDEPAATAVARLQATAAPAAAGPGAAGYGAGIVDPYAAVSAPLAAADPAASSRARPGLAVRAMPAGTAGGHAGLALALGGATLLAAVAVAGAAAGVSRARRRRWRPGLTPVPARRWDDSPPAPPTRLFADRGA
jgi:subtilisin family serine protease